MAKTQLAAFVQYGAIANSNTLVQMKRFCRALRITVDAGASDVYLELNGDTPAVGGATSIKVAAGTTWESPAAGNLGISSFRYIGSGAVGNFLILGI